MRHLRLFRLIVWPCAATILVLAGVRGPASAQTVDESLLEFVSSRQYIVIDADSGVILAEKDPNGRAGMASVTKIFTAIVALERAPLDFEIAAQESDLFDQTSTTMPGFIPGNVYTVEDLLYGMMLQSANDAAEALARGIAFQAGDSPRQSVDRFMGWINDKAAELGLSDTNLANPHGLSAPDHYSTPRDIAAWMLYAIENPVFMDLAAATQFTVSTGDIMYSINRAPQFIPYHIAGKTGFDNDTGYCLAELQQIGDTRLITVTLDGVAPDIWYQDHAILADFGASALQARVDSGDPITGDIVALAPTSGDQEVAQAEPTPTPDVRVPESDDGPRPVPVDATPVPVALRDETDGISGEWLAPLLILGVIAATLVMRSGWRLPAPRREGSD